MRHGEWAVIVWPTERHIEFQSNKFHVPSERCGWPGDAWAGIRIGNSICDVFSIWISFRCMRGLSQPASIPSYLSLHIVHLPTDAIHLFIGFVCVACRNFRIILLFCFLLKLAHTHTHTAALRRQQQQQHSIQSNSIQFNIIVECLPVYYSM